MPIYDYTCSSCRRVTEVIHGIDDHGPKFCPECGSEGTMTKKFVAPTFHFKGSGWAKKDRSSSARAASARDEKGGGESEPSVAKSDGGSGSGSSGETKPPAESTDTASEAKAPAGKPSAGSTTPSSLTSD